MGKIKKTLPVKLIMGMISRNVDLFDQVTQILVEKFGPVDLKSSVFNFDKTGYYKEEMGENLKRQFLSFHALIEPKELVEVKLFTNSLEESPHFPGINQAVSLISTRVIWIVQS